MNHSAPRGADRGPRGKSYGEIVPNTGADASKLVG